MNILDLPSWAPDWIVKPRQRPSHLHNHIFSWHDVLSNKRDKIYRHIPYFEWQPGNTISFRARRVDTIKVLGSTYDQNVDYPSIQYWLDTVLQWIQAAENNGSTHRFLDTILRTEDHTTIINHVEIPRLKNYCLKGPRDLERGYIDFSKLISQSSFRCCYRRLIITEDGLIGMASAGVSEGDSIYIINCHA
jgi:hypothetical protein